MPWDYVESGSSVQGTNCGKLHHVQTENAFLNHAFLRALNEVVEKVPNETPGNGTARIVTCRNISSELERFEGPRNDRATGGEDVGTK